MEFKGYRNPNGNYITVTEQKKQYNRYKKDLKQARKEREQENEQKDQLYFAMVRDEKKEEQKAVEQEQLFIQQAKQFISHAAETLPYNEYLIAWDIANRNRMQIEADIYNNKITLEQVKKVFTLAQNYIDNLTDKIYMKDLLTT
jgi:hypothetical protein